MPAPKKRDLKPAHGRGLRHDPRRHV